uniref:Lipid/polyisoprenoid-binding YceI-like domain-containing protein n=1 Tax=Ditylum brightwellii TaxID=49249 RepID=A0A6V2HLQ3_9STRA
MSHSFQRMIVIAIILLTSAVIKNVSASTSSSSSFFPFFQKEKDQSTSKEEEEGSILNLSVPMSISYNWPPSPHYQSQQQQQRNKNDKYYLSDDMLDEDVDDLNHDYHSSSSSSSTVSYYGMERYGMGREYDILDIFKKPKVMTTATHHAGKTSASRAAAAAAAGSRNNGWSWWKKQKVETPRRIVATVPNPSYFRNNDSSSSSPPPTTPTTEPTVSATRNSNLLSSIRKSLFTFPSSSQSYFSSSTGSQSNSTLPTTKITLPRIKCHIEPNTIVKIRKTFHFTLPSIPTSRGRKELQLQDASSASSSHVQLKKKKHDKSTLIVGANYNVQDNTWSFRTSLDNIPYFNSIGGKNGGGRTRLLLIGKELQLCNTWLISLGSMEDFVTRLRFRAAVDVTTLKTYAKFGFRAERLNPMNLSDGFTIRKHLSLLKTGNVAVDNKVKMEIKANVAFPKPDIEYTIGDDGNGEDGSGGGVLGMSMGDIEIHVDELNLLLDY